MMLEALLWLFVKHFICDFPLQTFPWLYRNKGIYMHPGGLVHAGLHGIGTLIVLAPFIGTAAFLYAAIDTLTHYHIDWAKIKLSQKYDLKPERDEWFWIVLGFDQLLHHLTYIVIIYYAFQYASS